MRFFADLHIHSKYSRATSKEMVLPCIASGAKEKGLSLVATGDFTHPLWREELKSALTPCANGIFLCDDVHFILESEVSNIYVKNGKLRKIHNLVYVPSFEDADRVSKALSKYGKLSSDGRPILSLPSEDMVEIIFETSKDAFIVPAHIWTPHFSLFGAFSGFDKIEECYGENTRQIFALETGLSSDPPMNWRISALDRFILISNSDAHSPRNLGREANCFNCNIDYFEIMNTLKIKDKERFKYTIEFFPEEGKYHYDGHRGCKARIPPDEAINHNNICPVCGRKITIGVLHRVHLLSDRKEGAPMPESAIPFKHLVPLREIISEVLSVGVGSMRVETEYRKLINKFGNEFVCLIDVAYDELTSVVGDRLADAIIKVREGKVTILPGYDGVYGEINISGGKKEKKQLTLF
jgi:uncharacterized protein (TIGR00375 family)